MVSACGTTDPLPADQKMLELAKKKEEDDAKQAEVKRQAETKKEKGGIMNKLGAVASEYSTKAQTGYLCEFQNVGANCTQYTFMDADVHRHNAERIK